MVGLKVKNLVALPHPPTKQHLFCWQIQVYNRGSSQHPHFDCRIWRHKLVTPVLSTYKHHTLGVSSKPKSYISSMLCENHWSWHQARKQQPSNTNCHLSSIEKHCNHFSDNILPILMFHLWCSIWTLPSQSPFMSASHRNTQCQYISSAKNERRDKGMNRKELWWEEKFHTDVLYGRPRILEDDDGSKAVMEEATVAGEPARLAAWRW